VNALLLDDPQDANKLEVLLSRILDNPFLGQKLGLAATMFAQVHQWAEIATMQERIYLEACLRKN
jgi:glycosyltransferase involved in cell wall biosynthesis